MTKLMLYYSISKELKKSKAKSQYLNGRLSVKFRMRGRIAIIGGVDY